MDVEEADQLNKDLPDLLELTPQDVLFNKGDWNAKVGSQDTWSNRQVWLWCTKSSRAKANRILPRENTGQSKHPFSTKQGMTLHMDITVNIKSD